MTRTEAQTKRLFDEWAKSYDADLVDATGPLIGYQQSLQALARGLPSISFEHLLDVGIGSGAVAAQFASRARQITGIDPSDEMLAVCQQKYPDFTLKLGTFHEIPAEDATFDAVVSGFAYHETPVEKRQSACEALARVLKPDGYLCLLDIIFASDAAMQSAAALVRDEWDDTEVYALVGDLDAQLHASGFVSISWQHTAPFHWMVTARKP